MDFARKQLEKYGWSEGRGLGKHEDGMSTAIKPKLKFDNAGIGHNVGEQFTNNWWESIFNSAADNIQVEVDNKNEIKMKLKSKDAVEITTKTYSVKDFKKSGGNLEYGSFLKTAKLTGSGDMEHYNTPSISEKKSTFQTLTDEELFAACGGRTAHKGARHGLKLGGKLSRIDKQEKVLLKKMKKVSLADNLQMSTEKKLKKLRNQKEKSKEKYIPIMEDSMESTSSNGLKKKKKRKSVSFSEHVTVTPFYTVDLDTSFESEVGSLKDGGNDLQLEAVNSILDEGIEQDIENNNNNYPDNHRSFEIGQFNINDLSKAERKKLKKKRKLESKKNTSTGLFLKKLNIDLDEDNNMKGFDKIDTNLKKRKYKEDTTSSKIGCHDKHKRKKEKLRIKKQSNVDDRLNSIVKSLDTVCRISESE